MRTTRTKEEMLELIAKHDKDATTVKEFCQLNGLTQGVFYYAAQTGIESVVLANKINRPLDSSPD
jgi:hypothetical protein